MRIVSGIYGSRKLETPKNRDIRPTSDKIRGSIFNALESLGAVEGAHTLDAYSGSGALGLEALSRGAEHCTFIDKAKSSLDLTRRNADSLGACGSSDFILGDASKINLKYKKFDLILLDPPYHKGLIELTLNNLINQSAVSSTGIVICESERESPTVHPEPFRVHSEKIYGDTKLTILRYIDKTPE